MKKWFAAAGLMLLLAGLNGCYRVDYVGKYYDATPDTQDVAVYHRGKEKVPVDKYVVIGRMTVVARYTNSIYHLEDYVAEEARKHGADAIEILDLSEKNISYYDTDEDEFGAPLKTAIPPDARFGSPAELHRDNAEPTTKPQLRLLLYKDRKAVKKLQEM